MPKGVKITVKPGDIFGNLTIVNEDSPYIPKSGRKQRKFICVCKCGTKKSIHLQSLTTKKSTSCGCHSSKNITDKKLHRMGKLPEYRIWKAMKERCNSKNNRAYTRYGGRGIFVCEEWDGDFTKFISDMGRRPSNEHSIDRKNNDGPYSPENCYWATRIEQANNKGNNHIITYNGETLSLANWAHKLRISQSTLTSRINTYKWSIEKSLTTPIREWPNRKKHYGATSKPEILKMVKLPFPPEALNDNLPLAGDGKLTR